MKITESQIKTMVMAEIKNYLKESKYYGEEAEATYEPLMGNVEFTEEEIDYLDQFLQPYYYITFHMYRTPATYDYPEEVEISIDGEDDVYADIEKIPEEELRKKVEQDFEEWKDYAEGNANYDYCEPDYDLEENIEHTPAETEDEDDQDNSWPNILSSATGLLVKNYDSEGFTLTDEETISLNFQFTHNGSVILSEVECNGNGQSLPVQYLAAIFDDLYRILIQGR